MAAASQDVKLEIVPIGGSKTPTDKITIGSAVPNSGQPYARGSQTNLLKRDDITVQVVRRTSGTDLSIAVKRRNSQSSQPNLLAVLGAEGMDQKQSDPMLGAQDALKRHLARATFWSTCGPWTPLERTTRRILMCPTRATARA